MAWDKVWEDMFSTRAWGKYPGEDVVRFVARHFYKVSNRAEIKILEVGCGTGANVWFIAREGFCIYGVDGSESAIKLSQQRLDEEVPGWKGELSVVDIVSLPFPDEYFDAVLDIEACSCNQFDESRKIYVEMTRVLKKGGKFYSRCFAKGTVGDEVGEPLGYNAYLNNIGLPDKKGLTRFTSRDDIDNLLPKNLVVTELDQSQRGILLKNPVIEWCITAEKYHE